MVCQEEKLFGRGRSIYRLYSGGSQFSRDFSGVAGLAHWPLSKEHFGKISNHLVILKN